MRDPNVILRQALLPLFSTAAAIGILAVLVYFIRVWFSDNDDPAESDNVLLSEYREMNERGELSDEEYRIIKCRFAPRIGSTPSPPADPSVSLPGKLEKDCRSEND
jgi:hypothetical protein